MERSFLSPFLIILSDEGFLLMIRNIDPLFVFSQTTNINYMMHKSKKLMRAAVAFRNIVSFIKDYRREAHS